MTSHRTSSIARPRRRRRVQHLDSRRGVIPPARTTPTPKDDDHTLLDELTRPIAVDRQLVTSRGPRRLFALAGLAVLVALVASMFVLPVQAWFRQRDAAAAKEAELQVLQDANATLSDEIDHLQTPEGSKEAARTELGVVGDGDTRIGLLAPSIASLNLPTGWPYDAISQIIAVRAAAPAEPASATSLP